MRAVAERGLAEMGVGRPNEYRLAFLTALSISHYLMNESAKAIGYADQGIAMSRELHELAAEQTLLGIRGVVLTESNDRGALNDLELALQISRQLKDQAAEATHLENLGRLYVRLGESKRGMEHLSEALTIALLTGDERARAGILRNIAFAQLRSRDPEAAWRSLDESQRIAEKVGDERLLGYIELARGYVSQERGNQAVAHGYFAAARRIADRLGERLLGDLASASSRKHLRPLGDADGIGEPPLCLVGATLPACLPPPLTQRED